MSALLAKKGCAWLGQERHQASYAPRHSRQDAGGRTRLQSRRRARISAAIRLVSAFARFDVTGCACSAHVRTYLSAPLAWPVGVASCELRALFKSFEALLYGKLEPPEASLKIPRGSSSAATR